MSQSPTVLGQALKVEHHIFRGGQIMGSFDDRLEKLGYPLDRLIPEGNMFDAVRLDGEIIYASGHVPFDGDKLTSKGKVPSQVSIADATAAAALCAANILRAVRRALGSLDRVSHVVRLTGYVNSDPDFTEQHLVMHGASQLVQDVFGDAGRHARSALGMAQLPLGSSVEVEMILHLTGESKSTKDT
jgi:enamine deaminase RidA (YjgF/YER057c/UK114 family)